MKKGVDNHIGAWYYSQAGRENTSQHSIKTKRQKHFDNWTAKHTIIHVTNVTMDEFLKILWLENKNKNEQKQPKQ